MTPEFSHIEKLSELGSENPKQSVVADEDQREALVKRFGLLAMEKLEATYQLQVDGKKIQLSGVINAALEQSCSISGEPVPVIVEEEFKVIFLPKTDLPESEEEIELAADDCDVVEYEDNKIDIGEAIAQTLYLSLDPFPRGPNADKVAEKQGLKSEEEAGPFGALAALKDKLG